MSYEDNIRKLSKVMISSGKTEYTPEKIEAEVKKIQADERLPTKTQAYGIFKSRPEVKRAVTLGEQQEVTFDVLNVSIRENESKKEPGTKFKTQEIALAINRANKPEISICTIWDGVIPVDAGNAYKAKVNIGKGNRVTLPVDGTYTKLEKLHFTAQDLKDYADPIENAKELTAGVWTGSIGEKKDKNDKMWLEVSSDGSFLPAKVWINDPEVYNELLKGDNVVFGGYYGKSGINATFIMKIEEKETEHKAELGKL